MLPIATLRALVEVNTTEGTAALAKFDASMKASAAQADAASNKIGRSASSAATKFAAAGTKMTAAGKVMTKAITLPLLGIGTASVAMSVQFKRQMGLIATDAGGSAKEVQHLEKSVLNLSRNTKYDGTELAKSLFHVESSGYRGAQAMKVLNESQKLATTGNSELESTTYALVSATKSLYGDSLKNVNRTAAELNGIVAHGDMRLEEFTSAMSTGVIPKAKSMGLNLRDVGAAMDVMTARGIPAQRAAYALGFTMQKLVPYGEKAEEAFARIGLGQEELVNASTKGPRGYVSGLEDLQRHLEMLPTQAQQTKAIEEMFGGGRMTSGLLTDLQNLGEMRKIYGELGDEVKKYHRHVKDAEEQPLVKLEKAWAGIKDDLIEIGSDLTPAALAAFQEIASVSGTIAHDFAKLSPSAQSWVLKLGLAFAAAGPLLVIGGKLLTVFEGVANATKASAVAMGLMEAESAATGGAGAAGGLLAGGGAAGGARWLGTDAPPVAAGAFGENAALRSSGLLGGAGAADAAGLTALGTIALPVGLGVGLAALTAAVMNTGSAFSDARDRFDQTAQDLEKKSIPAWKKTAIEVKRAHEVIGGVERNASLSAVEKQTGMRGSLIAHPGEGSEAQTKLREAMKPLHEAEVEFGTAMARINLDQLAGLGKLNTDLDQALGRADNAWKHGTDGWRLHTVDAMERTVAAIRSGMASGSISASQGQKAIDNILSEIKLVKGSDPLGLASGVVSSFKQAGAVTQQGINELVRDFKQMPKGAQEQSQDAVLAMTREWAAGHPKIEHQVDVLRHNLESKFGATKTAARREWHKMTEGMTTDFGNLATSVGGSAEDIQTIVNSMLTKLNVGKIVNFGISHGDFAGAGIGTKPEKKQHGGMVVPGTGTGDKVPLTAMVEPGEVVHVLNMRAAQDRAKLAGLENLNSSVPRFQKGGAMGAEPRIGGSGPLQAIGQGATHEMYGAAKQYVAKHMPKGGVTVPGGGGAVLAQIARVLAANGFNKRAIAGIMGNAYRESTWNPGAVGTGGGGLWGFTSGAISLAALQAAAQRANTPWTDASFQTGFMLRHGGLGLRGTLNAAGSPEEAAAIFMRDWERPGIPAQGERESAARKAFSMGYQRGGVVGLQKGGSAGASDSAWRGAYGTSGLHSGVKNLVSYVLGKWPEMQVTSTTGGEHATNSLHYQGEAVDIGASSRGYEHQVAEWINSSGLYHALAEGIHNPNLSVVEGKHTDPSYWGSATWGEHLTHIHLGVTHPWTTADAGSEGGKAGKAPAENVPAVFHGAHTKSLSFGSMPKNLHGVEAEIKRWSSELTRYRHAAKAAKGMPKTERAIQANVKAIEQWIRKLNHSRAILRRKLAQKHFQHRTHHALGKITGVEKAIEASQRSYEIAAQTASQIVELEPQQPELPASASEADQQRADLLYAVKFQQYVQNKEEPAFKNVLDQENQWRNLALTGESTATDLEQGWEGRIRKLSANIQGIDNYTVQVARDVSAWKAANPKAKELPKNLKAEEKKRDELRKQLPMMRFKEAELRKVLGEGRAEFYGGVKSPIHPPMPPLAGSGTLEESLKDVQGVHWPDYHEKLGSLPGKRAFGHFGGAIWETQGEIEGLGLKIAQAVGAVASAGGSGSSGTGGDNEALFRELLTQQHQRDLVAKAQAGVRPPYAGAYATGGIVSALVGERGPELATFPTGTRVTPAGDTSRALSPTVVVHVYEGEGRAEVEVDGKKTDAKIQKHDRRTARGAGRGLARAGVFG